MSVFKLNENVVLQNRTFIRLFKYCTHSYQNKEDIHSPPQCLLSNCDQTILMGLNPCSLINNFQLKIEIFVVMYLKLCCVGRLAFPNR